MNHGLKVYPILNNAFFAWPHGERPIGTQLYHFAARCDLELPRRHRENLNLALLYRDAIDLSRPYREDIEVNIM